MTTMIVKVRLVGIVKKNMDNMLALIIIFLGAMIFMSAILAMQAVPQIFKNTEITEKLEKVLSADHQHAEYERNQLEEQMNNTALLVNNTALIIHETRDITENNTNEIKQYVENELNETLAFKKDVLQNRLMLEKILKDHGLFKNHTHNN